MGSVADLNALSAALHARCMFLMVDVTVNNMAWMGDESTVDYSSYDTFNLVRLLPPTRFLGLKEEAIILS